MEQASGVSQGVWRDVCAQFHQSDRYQKLLKTYNDYCYSRDLLLGKPPRVLLIRKPTSALIQRIVNRLADEGTPSKAAHVLCYLRRVLQWSRNGGYLDSNTAQGIEAPVERKRRRFPEHRVMEAMVDRALALGRLARNDKGAAQST